MSASKPKASIFTVPAVPGSSRSSFRPYTHAVVGRQDLDKARAFFVDNAKYMKAERSNWMFRKRIAEVGIGGVWAEPQGFTVDADMYQKAVDFLAKHPTADDWVAYATERAVERINERGTGAVGKLFVLQWSMSEKNAAKGLPRARQWCVDVQIVPVIEVTNQGKG